MFEAVADVLIANNGILPSVEAKSVCDRYEKLQKHFNAKDHHGTMTSGVGGEVSEAQEVLSLRREAWEEQKFEKLGVQEATSIAEHRKMDAGERLVVNALEISVRVVDCSDTDSKNSENHMLKRAKCSSRYNHDVDFKRDRFTAIL